jgi:hypothetical protein
MVSTRFTVKSSMDRTGLAGHLTGPLGGYRRREVVQAGQDIRGAAGNTGVDRDGFPGIGHEPRVVDELSGDPEVPPPCGGPR